MQVGADDGLDSVRIDKPGVPPEDLGHHRVQCRREEMPAWLKHSGELPVHGSEVCDVLQSERTDDAVDRVIGDWKVGEVADAKLGVWHLRAGSFEHLGRRVDSDDRAAVRVQVGEVAAGATGRVEDDAIGEAVEELSRDRFLEGDQRVARGVIGRRPRGVAAGDVEYGPVETDLHLLVVELLEDPAQLHNASGRL